MACRASELPEKPCHARALKVSRQDNTEIKKSEGHICHSVTSSGRFVACFDRKSYCDDHHHGRGAFTHLALQEVHDAASAVRGISLLRAHRVSAGRRNSTGELQHLSGKRLREPCSARLALDASEVILRDIFKFSGDLWERCQAEACFIRV